MKPKFPRTLILLLLCTVLVFALAAGSIADFGGFADDNAAALVDKQAAANSGARVDFNAG